MKADKLIDKIIKHLEDQNTKTDTDWGIANGVYGDCMNNPHPSNGGRIAAIRKACYKSEFVGQIGGHKYCILKF